MESKWPELPDIFEYLDYRAYLNAVIELLRAHDLYSTRKFAALVGFKSSTYMKRILDGKRKLSDSSLVRIADGFRLNKIESAFLKRLVDFNHAGSPEEKDQRFQDLLKFKRFQRLRRLETSQYEYYSRWYTSALFVALGTDWNKKSTSQMAAALGISVEEVAEGLQILQQLNLVYRDGSHYRAKDMVLESSAETNSMNVRNFHREMLKKGLTSLDRYPTTERDVQALTIALSKKNYQLFKERITKFRQELALLFTDEPDPEVLYQLHFLFFPLLNLKD